MQFKIECSDLDLASIANQLFEDYESYCSEESKDDLVDFAQWLKDNYKIEDHFDFDKLENCYTVKKNPAKEKLTGISADKKEKLTSDSLFECLDKLTDKCFQHLPETYTNKINQLNSSTSSANFKPDSKSNPKENSNKIVDAEQLKIILSVFGALLSVACCFGLIKSYRDSHNQPLNEVVVEEDDERVTGNIEFGGITEAQEPNNSTTQEVAFDGQPSSQIGNPTALNVPYGGVVYTDDRGTAFV